MIDNADDAPRSVAGPRTNKGTDAATITDYYASGTEEFRLLSGAGLLEHHRMRDLLGRFLPPPPVRIIDAGGGAGVHAFWLAGMGHEVHLLDLSPALIQKARRRHAGADQRLASIEVGDARLLPFPDQGVDAVLLLGPLYHLVTAADRERTLAEARRVLRSGGILLAAGISRHASLLDGMVRGHLFDPRFAAMVRQDLATGQHRNPHDVPSWFTSAYFHLPADLAGEVSAAGFRDVRLLGIEGPGWLLTDGDWTNPVFRQALCEVATLVEEDPLMQATSAHLLAVGMAP